MSCNRFDKAVDHRQWGAQFVRDIGNEIAAHGLDALQMGDVAADEASVCRRRRRSA